MANVWKTGRGRGWLLAGIAAAAACAALAIRGWLQPSLSAELDIEPYAPAAIAVPQGAAWQPTDVDAQGFAVAARTADRELLVHPGTGQVIVRDASGGAAWRSNPDAAALEKEKVGGTLRTNLESPFILEYYEQSKVQRLVTNARDPSVKLELTAIDGGMAVRFDIGKLGIAFSMLYELTDDGLRVSVPGDGIAETGRFRLLSIDPLPFFGAADDAVPGYLLVPDGPGGLIRFPSGRALVGSGYYQHVYGPELTNKTFGPVAVSMPVFGLKRGDTAFVAVVAEGEKASAIRALPAGVVSSLHSVNVRFLYREEYNRRLNLSGRAIRMFQEEPLREDRVVQYLFLEGEDADYVGMAQRYRRHLLDTGQLQPPQPADRPSVPLHLTIVGGDTIYYGNRRYETATTFVQAEDMLRQLKAASVDDVRVDLLNWQAGGSLATTLKPVVERKLGGEAGLKSLIETAHELGYRLYLTADVATGDSEALKLPPKTYGVRSVEGDVLFDDEYFFLNPNVTYNLARDLIDAAHRLGADGIVYDGLADTLFRDYNPKYGYTRSDTAYVYDRILEMTRRELGAVGAYTGNAYALRSLTDIRSLPSESRKYYAVDDTVPFYPMALHGSVAYSFTAGNLRDDYETELLKAIEYGAVPAFVLTAESSRTLMDTKTWGLFTSRFAQWREKVVQEYVAFRRLAATADQPMTGHERLAEGVYSTAYANGTKVVVDYNAKTFRVEEGSE